MNGGPSPESARHCGECSLCCTLLRVDELKKLGGVACREVIPGRGCGIHASRPGICRAYRCLWLQGGLDPDDRPDQLGAVLDLVTAGTETLLLVHQATPDAYDGSHRLRAIVARYRETMSVRLTDVEDVLDADRPYRILMPGGEERRVEGEWVTTLEDGVVMAERRLPWIERWVRRVGNAWRRRRLHGFGAGSASSR